MIGVVGVVFYYMAEDVKARALERKDLIEMVIVDGVDCIKMKSSTSSQAGVSITCNWDKFNTEMDLHLKKQGVFGVK